MHSTKVASQAGAEKQEKEEAAVFPAPGQEGATMPVPAR